MQASAAAAAADAANAELAALRAATARAGDAALVHTLAWAAIAPLVDGSGAGQLVGQGACGTVFRGDLPGMGTIAVKLVLARPLGAAAGPAGGGGSGSSGSSSSSLNAELDVLRRLDHPRLLCLRSYALRPGGSGDVAIVTDFLPRGSLHDYLHPGPTPGAAASGGQPRPTQDWATRLRMAQGVTEGLLYLHTQRPPVVHRDLKPASEGGGLTPPPPLPSFTVAAAIPVDARGCTAT